MIGGIQIDYAPPPPRNSTWKHSLRNAGLAVLLIGTLVGVLVGGWVLLYDIRTSPGTRDHEEVDRRSGRIRRTHYSRWSRTSRVVQQSAVWDALPPGVANGGGPDWHLVKARADGSPVGPQWGGRDASAQIKAMEALWKTGALTEGAKSQVAQAVLSLWQADGGFSKADEYLHAVEAAAAQTGGARPLAAGDLPPAGGQPQPLDPALTSEP